MISKEEVKHIAKLARLGLKEKEIKKMQKELSSILNYVAKLKEVDVSSAQATSYSVAAVDELRSSSRVATARIENVMRADKKDEVRGSKIHSSKKLLELAPDKKDNYLKVKAIF